MQVGAINQISDILKNTSITNNSETKKDNSFSNIFNAAMNLLNDTNSLQLKADDIGMEFLSGNTNVNIEDVLIASKKASTALQFTVEIRNQVLAAYDEIMKLQI
ncbi:MAG: fliE [Clostridiales bacterium]|jgi:flagellar hook-basal body complex protein FliE|nr:fliE [Clostridiales bacterium]